MDIDGRPNGADATKNFSKNISRLRHKLKKFEKKTRFNARSKEFLHFFEIHIIWIIL
jgi:hypothetical protein